MSATFLRDPDNGYPSGYVYGRTDNASVQQAESFIATLEGADEALLFSSGMAAATSIFLALERPTHIIASQVMYWGFRSWLREVGRYGHAVTFVETSDLDAVREAIRPRETGVFWIETPSNPLWTVTDIGGIAEIAHANNAIVCVDSTVATPILTRPLSLGADIVMHSATKYLNGHSDIIAGALATARNASLWQRIRKTRGQLGSALGGFEAWLLMRGMRTLGLRVRRQALTAAMLAARLVEHPAVSVVLYPGLETHAGHAGGAAADERRIRRHVVDPHQRGRCGSDCCSRRSHFVETCHLIWRHRKPDRAPCVDRGRRLAVPRRSIAFIGRPRKPR